MTEPTNELEQLRKEVSALRDDIHGLLEAWRTASGVVKAVKWLGKVAAAVTTIYALFKLGGGK
ncbi:hypothetical protein ACO2Q2_16530 [Dyella sp. KRB-257]|uniref:hypothetical protein n=1 Tax=Dyella sp. KRB-257 TaxID=3400915 RepID=UPI003C081351